MSKASNIALAVGLSGAAILALYLTCSPPWAKCHKLDPVLGKCVDSCQFLECNKSDGWMDGPCPQ